MLTHCFRRTVIGSDGSVSREFRFRSQSTVSAPDKDGDKGKDKGSLVTRQQSEPAPSSTVAKEEEESADPSKQSATGGNKENVSPQTHTRPQHKPQTIPESRTDTDSQPINNNNKQEEDWNLIGSVDQLLRKNQSPLLTESKGQQLKGGDDDSQKENNDDSKGEVFSTESFIRVESPSKVFSETQFPPHAPDTDITNLNTNSTPVYENKAFIEVTNGHSSSVNVEQIKEDDKNNEDKVKESQIKATKTETKSSVPKKKSVIEEISSLIEEEEKTMESILNDDNVKADEKQYSPVYKSSLDFQLPANSFYQTSVPLAGGGGGGGGEAAAPGEAGGSSSMLDFCLSRPKTAETKPKLRGLKLPSCGPEGKARPQLRPSLSRPPASGRRRLPQRSKSYAGGGVVSLTQCPLCGRQFEK